MENFSSRKSGCELFFKCQIWRPVESNVSSWLAFRQSNRGIDFRYKNVLVDISGEFHKIGIVYAGVTVIALFCFVLTVRTLVLDCRKRKKYFERLGLV